MLLLIAYMAGRLAPEAQKGLWLFEVILHVGAHRTGTTSLQRALHQNRQKLKKNETVFLGPQQMRGGRFSGLLRATGMKDAETKRLTQRSEGVISIELERLAKVGVERLIVSEENILGSVRNNLRTAFLYPRLAERLARFSRAFGGSTHRIGLAIRLYEDYWASSLAFVIPKGRAAPSNSDLDCLVEQPGGWRRVISDIAEAFPTAQVSVWEFDRLIERPQAQFRVLTRAKGHIRPLAEKHNPSAPREELRELLRLRGEHEAANAISAGNGRNMLFAGHHIQALQARYQEDLAWLRAKSPMRMSFVDKATPDAFATTQIEQRGLA